MGDLGVILFGTLLMVFFYCLGIVLLWRYAARLSARYLRPLPRSYHIGVALMLLVGLFLCRAPYKSFLFANLVYFGLWAVRNKEKSLQKKLNTVVAALLPFYLLNVIGFSYFDMAFSRDDSVFIEMAKKELTLYLLGTRRARYVDADTSRCRAQLLRRDFVKTYQKISEYLATKPEAVRIGRPRGELPFVAHDRVRVTIDYPVDPAWNNVSDYRYGTKHITVRNKEIHFDNHYALREKLGQFIDPFTTCLLDTTVPQKNAKSDPK